MNYKRVAAADGKEVAWEEIVKGYEYEKGKYIVLKEEDFARVDVEATQTVDIVDFVQLEEVSPIFFYKPYYMEPREGRRQSLHPAPGSAELHRQDRDRQSGDQDPAVPGGGTSARARAHARTHALCG